MTGYPGDEHVFSVVVIVLARSPDCNLRSLVFSVSLRLWLHCVVFDLRVLHLLCILRTVKVSTVYLLQVCRVLCAFRQLIPKQQLTRNAAAAKRTAVFTSGFGAEVEGSKREYAASRDWFWDNERGRAFLERNERVLKSESGESSDVAGESFKLDPSVLRGRFQF